MGELLLFFAAGILFAVALALIRILRGPSAADRIMGAQLASTGGIAVLLLVAAATQNWSVIDVALVLALLAAFASVGFVKAASEDGAGDPEEDAPWSP